MKKSLFLKLLALVVFLSSALSASAYDFASAYNGVTIYYNITSSTNKTVEVTYKEDGYFNYHDAYIGAVTIPSSVYYNGSYYTVTAIGDDAFRQAGQLTAISIPSTVTSIGKRAFYANEMDTYPNQLTTVTIPNSVQTIDEDAFGRCYSLSSVTIGNGVTTIGDYAFCDCALTSVTIPNNVVTIGKGAFYGCQLQTVILGFKVSSIGNYAFRDADWADIYCYAYFPPTIYDNTFSHYSGPQTISGCLYTLSACYNDYCSASIWSTFRDKYTISGSTAYDTKIGDFYYKFYPYITNDKCYAVVTNNGNYNCYPNTSYAVPATVAWRGEAFNVFSISADAFRGSTSVKTVDLSNATYMKYINSYAFYGCTNLWKVLLPPNLITESGSPTGIEAYAFSNTGLTNLYTNSSTPPNISSTAFEGRYTRCTVYVPYPRDIATYQAAQYWSNFYTINSAQSYDFYKSGIYYRITGSNTVELATADPINLCSYTGSVSVPSSVTWNNTTYNVTAVGEWAFSEAMPVNLGASPKGYSPGSLKSVSLPSSITTIKSNAFNSCTGLTGVTIGSGVTSIGSDAFNYCTSLVYLGISRTTPPTIQSSTFNSSHYSTVVVNVPPSAVGVFRAATYWKNFYMIVPNNVTALNYALNVSGGSMSFTNTGDYQWKIKGDGTRIYAQSSNEGVASSASILTSSVSLSKAHTLTFDFKAWGEGTNYDVCIFSIDDVEQFRYGARDNDWETFTASIAAGTHTLTWTYQKDGSVNPTGDYFALDNVKLTEVSVQPGDVNGDNDVTIADVSALIDILLGNAAETPGADVNGDNQVTIADVSALIDFLLEN